MNLLQKLQARTATAQKATPEEVQILFDAIVSKCLFYADIGKDSAYINSSTILVDASGRPRPSSFDDAFTRAIAQISKSGVDVKTTSDKYIFLLEWGD